MWKSTKNWARKWRQKVLEYPRQVFHPNKINESYLGRNFWPAAACMTWKWRWRLFLWKRFCTFSNRSPHTSPESRPCTPWCRCSSTGSHFERSTPSIGLFRSCPRTSSAGHRQVHSLIHFLFSRDFIICDTPFHSKLFSSKNTQILQRLKNSTITTFYSRCLFQFVNCTSKEQKVCIAR